MKLAHEGYMAPLDAWGLTQEALDKALALDPNSSEPHTSQAIVNLLIERNWWANQTKPGASASGA